jgi:hypothetical protein
MFDGNNYETRGRRREEHASRNDTGMSGGPVVRMVARVYARDRHMVQRVGRRVQEQDAVSNRRMPGSSRSDPVADGFRALRSDGGKVLRAMMAERHPPRCARTRSELPAEAARK